VFLSSYILFRQYHVLVCLLSAYSQWTIGHKLDIRHKKFMIHAVDIRGDQEGLFKLVTLNGILNRIIGVTFGC
jgi:hypothetical protein